MEGFNKLYGNLFSNRQIKDDFAGVEKPKYKFNYLVQFEYRSLDAERGGETIQTNPFPVKQMGRPSPIISYQDVNYYGFRTKVATKTDFATFNLSFYDDSSNVAHGIMEEYVRAVSPITRARDANVLRNFNTIGALDSGTELGPIKTVKLHHFYRNKGMRKKTTYYFFNPKVTNFMLDELDMTVSEVSSVTLTFNFDAFRIEQNTLQD